MTSAGELQIAKKNVEEETTNFYRIIGLVVDVGSKILREVIYSNYSPEDLKKTWQSHKSTIEFLNNKGKLFPGQYTLLTKALPDPEEFDIPLLVVVLRNICTKKVEAPDHSKKWKADPKQLKETDRSLGAEILRLKGARNGITAHTPTTRMPTDKFNVHWKNICEIIRRIATKINLTQDQMSTFNKEIEEISEMIIVTTGAKESEWLETFRKGQLEVFDEIKKDIGELLCKCNEQLRELLAPWMGKMRIKIDKLIIQSPDDERSSDSEELSTTLQDVEKVLQQDRKKILYYGYDAYIFYAETDRKACQDDIKILKEWSTVPKLKIALYEDLPLEELPASTRMAYILENCRFLLFYVTSSFTDDTLTIFEKDMCLLQVIKEKSYRAIPLWKERKDRIKKPPLDLNTIEGFDLWRLTGTADEQQLFIKRFDKHFKQGRIGIP